MNANDATHTVGEVVRMAHVSVRALHHYDELGPLQSSQRSETGCRLYRSGDLERLHQVLFYKELGFGLDEIRHSIADPGYDRREALLALRRGVAARALCLEAVLALIDGTLASLEGGTQMRDEEMFEVFGDFEPSEYKEKARERWGDTAAYRKSARRTRSYTQEDWASFKVGSDALNADLATLMNQGVAPGDPRAMDAIERHRLRIDRWFYPCYHEMHVELGRMYVADPRFAATYEKIHPGMAQYVCEAIGANPPRAAGA